MKRVLKLGIMLSVIFMVTGCVKMELTMAINKDKSMNLEIIQAVDKSLMDGNNSSFDTDSLKKAEDQGFLVRNYNNGNMEGYTLVKKFDNIDKLSTEENNYVSDFSEILENSDLYIFSIKKGFLKNTYDAKLKISNSNIGNDFSSITGDSFNNNSNTQGDDYNYQYSWSTPKDDNVYEYNWSLSEDGTINESSNWSNSDSEFSNDIDYTKMIENMEMNFVVNLPYKVINSNATSIDNDGKNLTWDLMNLKDKTINFEFELYNMTNVYIVVGIVLTIVSLLVVFIIKKVGNINSNKPKTISTNKNTVNSKNTYTSTLNDNNGNNNFINSYDSFNNQDIINNSTQMSNSSNNLFFNSQDFKSDEVNDSIEPSTLSFSNNFNPLDQFDNSQNHIDTSVNVNMNNNDDSIFTYFNSVNVNNLSQQSVVPEPMVQQPIIPEPIVQQPIIPEPMIQQPVIPEPMVQQSVVPEPMVQQSVIPEPMIQQPVIPEPIVQQPVGPEPMIQQSVIPEPMIQQPVIPEPVISNKNVEINDNKFF